MYFYIPPYEHKVSHKRKYILIFIGTTFALLLLVVTVLSFSSSKPFLISRGLGIKETPTSAANTVPSDNQSSKSIPGNVGPTTSNLKPLVSLTVSQNGAIIEGIDVTGEISIVADNVTLRNFRANNVSIGPDSKNILIEDGEITGQSDARTTGVAYANYTARRLNIHGTEDGFKAMGNVVIENCWVHDLAFAVLAEGTTHNDGVQISAGDSIVVRLSKFERIKGTSAIFIKPDQGTISNVSVVNNILGGGSYSLYVVGTEKFGQPKDIVITDNVFLSEHQYGYMNIESPSVISHRNTTQSGIKL